MPEPSSVKLRRFLDNLLATPAAHPSLEPPPEQPVPSWVHSRSPSLRLYRPKMLPGAAVMRAFGWHPEIYPTTEQLTNMMMEGALNSEILSKFPRYPVNDMSVARKAAIQQLQQMNRLRGMR